MYNIYVNALIVVLTYCIIYLGSGEGKMSTSIIFRIAAVGILVTVLNQILKSSGRDDLAYLTGLAGLILVLFWVLPYIAELFETIQTLFQI